jgi:hypothetical protein
MKTKQSTKKLYKKKNLTFSSFFTRMQDCFNNYCSLWNKYPSIRSNIMLGISGIVMIVVWIMLLTKNGSFHFSDFQWNINDTYQDSSTWLQPWTFFKPKRWLKDVIITGDVTYPYHKHHTPWQKRILIIDAHRNFSSAR